MRTRITIVAAFAAVTAMVVASPAAQASVSQTTEGCAAPDGRVTSSVITSGRLFIGGTFTHVLTKSGSSEARSGLAAIDVTTCDLVLDWKADVAGGAVNTLAASGGTLYAGGAFTSVSGSSHGHLAAVDTSSGAVSNTFNFSTDKLVNALTISGTTLYVGGKFSKLGGVNRAKLAAINLSAETLSDSWQPTASGTVSALTPSFDGSRIYVGGAFTELNGDPGSAYVEAVDAVVGTSDPTFQPSFESGGGFPILGLTADDRGVYAGGGGHGGHLVIWNLDGSLQRPIYQTDGGVQAVAMDGDSLYAGGHFTNYCMGNTGSGHPFVCDNALPRAKLFEVSLSSGSLTDWAPKLNTPRGVFAEAVDTATHDLYVAGDFTTINGIRQAHLGKFPAAP